MQVLGVVVDAAHAADAGDVGQAGQAARRRLHGQAAAQRGEGVDDRGAQRRRLTPDARLFARHFGGVGGAGRTVGAAPQFLRQRRHVQMDDDVDDGGGFRRGEPRRGRRRAPGGNRGPARRSPITYRNLTRHLSGFFRGDAPHTGRQRAGCLDGDVRRQPLGRDCAAFRRCKRRSRRRSRAGCTATAGPLFLGKRRRHDGHQHAQGQ